jgi:Xaa-Pro aminopeptidase
MTVPVDLLRGRHQRLQTRLTEAGVQAALITSRSNVTYLTGFEGSAGVVIVEADALHLLSDSRYAEEVHALDRAGLGLCGHVTPAGTGLEVAIAAQLQSLGACAVGYEPAALTVAQFDDLRTRAGGPSSALRWVAIDAPVESLRQRKDAWELATLREAGRRLSTIAGGILTAPLTGRSERDVAALVEAELRRQGFDKPAFDTIVASGPNGARPHHRAGDRTLAEGDLVVVDFGGFYRGYAVDMTRTLQLGETTQRQRGVWTAVLKAQQAAFAALQPGVAADAVDAEARRVLAEAGVAEFFSHGLGHGLGLEVHEAPRLGPRRGGAAGAPLEAGMVFTLEPGVYIPGWGGVRIEDDVVMTPSGPEWLTAPMVEG